jgi:hypothetical protein
MPVISDGHIPVHLGNANKVTCRIEKVTRETVFDGDIRFTSDGHVDHPPIPTDENGAEFIVTYEIHFKDDVVQTLEPTRVVTP